MAGITDGEFCKSISSEGFDMVTLGGYNADSATILAGLSIMERGRPEFNVKEHHLLSYLKEQVALVKDQREWDGQVSINIRSTSPAPVIKISEIEGVDVVEINAHCRQPEILDLGCGQALLQNPKKLEKFTQDVVESSQCQVSVKIRANVPGVDEIEIARAVECGGADYLHVDAMKPGFNTADYNVISSLKKNISIFLIGNNSVKDIDSAHKMLHAGADGISIARAASDGTLNFDLSLI